MKIERIGYSGYFGALRCSGIFFCPAVDFLVDIDILDAALFWDF